MGDRPRRSAAVSEATLVRAPDGEREAAADATWVRGPVPDPALSRPPRVRLEAAVDLSSDSNFFQGFSTNISEGGLFVATTRLLPTGTPIDLHFTLPEGQAVDAKGEVRWLRESNVLTPGIVPGIGVQFSEVSEDAAAAIRRFVAGREPIFFAE